MACTLSVTCPFCEQTGMCAGTNAGRVWRGSAIRSSSAVTCTQMADWALTVTRSPACAVAPGASITGLGRTDVSWAAALPIGPRTYGVSR